MSRYGKYFLRHLLWLEDSFCDYYVQSDFWGRPEIPDVAYVIFNYREDAAYWMVQCAKWDPHTTIRRLRSFLAKQCLTQYQVHRMNDRQVMRTAARELCMNAYRVVIKPRIGWAVRMDPETQAPVQPIAVQGAPDLDGLLDELKIHLDAMVADRQRQTEQLNAKLAEMNALEKSWELQKRTFKSAPQYLPLRNAVDALRALPDTAKTMGRLLATGGHILDAAADAIRAGSMEPIQSEIKQAVAPLVETAQQARQATAMVQVLLSDEETYALLYDFGERYVKAMHPLDIAEYGMKAASVIVTLIASIAAMIYTGGTSGAGTVGKLLVSIKRLREASPVVEKIYNALKCIAYRTKLPELIEKGVSRVKKRRAKNKGKSGVPEVKAPDKIDKNKEKGYLANNDSLKKKKTKLPQGLTQTQFDDAAGIIRSKAGHLGDDIAVHGSRASGTAKATSDIDFAIRVSPGKFDSLIKNRFGTPNAGSAKLKTMQHAIKTGKIQAGEAGLREVRRQLQKQLGMKVDLSVIKTGGAFDKGPYIPIP